MAFDGYIWFEGCDELKGGIIDAQLGDKGAIEVYSFSWGASNPTTVGSGDAGLSAGRVSLSAFNFMKKADSSSPGFFADCASGKHITKAHVALRKSVGDAKAKPKNFYMLEFTSVYVESVQWSGSGGGDDVPTESVSLAFAAVKFDFQALKSDGSEDGGPKSGSYDIKKKSTQ